MFTVNTMSIDDLPISKRPTFFVGKIKHSTAEENKTLYLAILRHACSMTVWYEQRAVFNFIRGYAKYVSERSIGPMDAAYTATKEKQFLQRVLSALLNADPLKEFGYIQGILAAGDKAKYSISASKISKVRNAIDPAKIATVLKPVKTRKELASIIAQAATAIWNNA